MSCVASCVAAHVDYATKGVDLMYAAHMLATDSLDCTVPGKVEKTTDMAKEKKNFPCVRERMSGNWLLLCPRGKEKRC